ncbi:MAG: hypothetical protein VKK04_21875 [Synechococcales bacterium]|nr:hypothetical protein [Synechococcales bacterium]
MTDPIDELLAQIKAEDEGGASAPQSPPSPMPPAKPVSSSSPAGAADGPKSVDDLLANIEGSSPAPPSMPSPVEQYRRSPPSTFSPDIGSPSLQSFPGAIAPTDPALAQLKAQYEEAEQEAARQRQQQQAAEQRQREEQARQQRAALVKQAEEWLKNLDPRSGEAIWFEELAEKYPSRLEAAIDYLAIESGSESNG